MDDKMTRMTRMTHDDDDHFLWQTGYRFYGDTKLTTKQQRQRNDDDCQ
jgi:hypothetical protein